MKKYILPFALLMTLLTACHAKHEFQADEAYHNAPRLKMPAGLSDGKFHDLYPVSSIGEVNASQDPSIIPPGSHIATYEKSMR